MPMKDDFIKNIVFDLDGTLIESFDDIAGCLKQAYAMLGVTTGFFISRANIGPPLREIIKDITPRISDEDTEKVVNNFRSLYDKSIFAKTKVYKGMRDLLMELKDAGRGLFIMTNKPAMPTKKIIELLEMNYFRDVISSDASGKDKKTMLNNLINKWGLEKPRTVIVGDGVSDIVAAKDNNVRSIGVLWGYSDKAGLAGANPDFMAEDIGSLRNILLSK